MRACGCSEASFSDVAWISIFIEQKKIHAALNRQHGFSDDGDRTCSPASLGYAIISDCVLFELTVFVCVGCVKITGHLRDHFVVTDLAVLVAIDSGKLFRRQNGSDFFSSQ